MGRSDSLPSFPTSFVSSLLGTARTSGDDRASQVPGGPSCTCPALSPRRGLHVRPSRLVGFAFRHNDGVGPHDVFVSWLNHAAHALPVYASPHGSPHAAQHSVPAASQAWPGGIRTRRVPAQSFRSTYIPSPLPGLCLAHRCSNSARSEPQQSDLPRLRAPLDGTQYIARGTSTSRSAW